jgi:hypothetical protein
MPFMATTIRQGIVLWLVVLCTMPGGFFHKQRSRRKYHPAPESQVAEQPCSTAELRDTETSYRFSRFRRYRRSERASEVVETLRSRNEWHVSSPSIQPVVSEPRHEADVCDVGYTCTILPDVPLRC